MALSFVSEEIHQYCLNHSSLPSPVCEAIEKHTLKNVEFPQMLSGALVASFLRFLVRSNETKNALEIGTYTGYSALAVAEALPTDGKLVTLDVNAETQKLARSFWDQSPHGKKIQALLAPALDSLGMLPGPFDFVFIDADKTGYLSYLKAVLPKLSPRGVIVADNTLWQGKVLDPQDADSKALAQFNDWVHSQSNLESVLLPIRDGLHVIRKTL